MRVVIRSQADRDRACALIQGWDEGPCVVTIGAKPSRSAQQNALYWQWLTVIANETGESKEEVHERCKGKYLVPIFERDDPEYAEMIKTVRDIYREGKKDRALLLHSHIVELTTTTKAGVAQMTEYLTDIEQGHTRFGISLPHPEDK